MKKILILLIAICCCGCSSIDIRNTVTTETTKIKYYRNDLAGSIYTIEIEGHLYIAIYEASRALGISRDTIRKYNSKNNIKWRLI